MGVCVVRAFGPRAFILLSDTRLHIHHDCGDVGIVRAQALNGGGILGEVLIRYKKNSSHSDFFMWAYIRAV